MSYEKEYFKVKKVPNYLKELDSNIKVGDIVMKLKNDNVYRIIELNGKYTCYLSCSNLTPIAKDEAMKYLFKE